MVCKIQYNIFYVATAFCPVYQQFYLNYTHRRKSIFFLKQIINNPTIKINLINYEMFVDLRKIRRDGKVNPRRRRDHAGRVAYR